MISSFQYQEDLNELNEIARHRPRSALIMNLAQENTQIRELQAENRELKLALEEHQNAISLIMTKYREQIVKLMLANKLDSNTVSVDQSSVSIILYYYPCYKLGKMHYCRTTRKIFNLKVVSVPHN